MGTQYEKTETLVPVNLVRKMAHNDRGSYNCNQARSVRANYRSLSLSTRLIQGYCSSNWSSEIMSAPTGTPILSR